MRQRRKIILSITFLLCRIEPYRIKHCPGVVLDVVLSTATLAAVEHAIQSGRPLNSDAITSLIENLVERVEGLTFTAAGIKDMVVEVLRNQQLMLDRLALIQHRAEAILTQNYELLEYTFPRLFIVLPETTTSRDPATMFRTKFRLHFICECGEHTRQARGTMAPASNIRHELHLARHEGYVVNRPTDFFRKYGPFLMVMLEMIKNGISIVGIIVPVVAAIDSVTSLGIDYSLKYLEETRALINTSHGVDVEDNARVVQEDLTSYLAGVEGLEGADLRQLGSYLAANSSDNLLGNMYRMTTRDGHVKWVCRDHYRAGYQVQHMQKLRDVVKLACNRKAEG